MGKDPVAIQPVTVIQNFLLIHIGEVIFFSPGTGTPLYVRIELWLWRQCDFILVFFMFRQFKKLVLQTVFLFAKD